MTQQIFNAFTAAVQAKLREAVDIYKSNINPEMVIISYNLRGKTAGTADVKNGQYRLRFNAEAVLKYNEDMTNDTIPHEIAHLICFDNERLGKDHDDGWKAVCRRLGGDDSRCHDMTLTAAKVVEKFTYTLASGRVVRCGAKHHRVIQSGGQVFWRNPKEYARPEQWEHYNKVPQSHRPAQSATPGLVIVRSDVPSLPQTGTKREKAEALFKANRHLARGEVINLFIQYADMTKAGAATYYQTFKSKGI